MQQKLSHLRDKQHPQVCFILRRTYMQNHNNQSLALDTVKKGIALNVLLAASKFAAGILGHSAALVSDAVDSASDIFSNLIVTTSSSWRA